MSAPKDQIVIVTQRDDPHADEVILALERTGHPAIRFNTDEVPSDTRISLGWDDTGFAGHIDILPNGRAIDTAAVRSVWWRRPGPFALPPDLTLQENEFASAEIEHALHSMWASLDCYWMSEPDRIRQASWKGEQLLRAQRLGFDVPRSLVTTDPDDARAFFAATGGRMIFKVLSDPFLGAAQVQRKHPGEELEQLETMTTMVTEAELDLLDSVRLVPCLFQEYVPKRVELRVTVIGEQVFAAEIDSQSDERTAVDWRHYDVDIPYRAVELPAGVADRCLSLVKSYGLNFSSMDLILTPDDRYVFVENNANGQFIFVEDRVPELEMTDALAACLVRGSN